MITDHYQTISLANSNTVARFIYRYNYYLPVILQKMSLPKVQITIENTSHVGMFIADNKIIIDPVGVVNLLVSGDPITSKMTAQQRQNIDLFILIHELRHMQQYAQGILKLGINEHNKKYYGKDYWIGGLTQDEYTQLPWEVDANNAARSVLSIIV